MHEHHQMNAWTVTEVEGPSWHHFTTGNPAWDFFPPKCPKLRKKDLEMNLLVSSNTCLWKTESVLDPLWMKERKRKKEKNIKESDNTAIKMADGEYNIYCKSIHQIKANVLTGKMISLNSNKSLLPERSKTIFIFPSLQGKLCYQNQILLIQLLHREI